MGLVCPNKARFVRHSREVSKINVANYFGIYTFLSHNSIFIRSYLRERISVNISFLYKWRSRRTFKLVPSAIRFNNPSDGEISLRCYCYSKQVTEKQICTHLPTSIIAG